MRALCIAVLLCALPHHSYAQLVSGALSCTDQTGRAVRVVQTTTGIVAKATVDDDGRRVIDVDGRRVDAISPQQQLFVYEHECAHHALGHDVTRPFTTVQEQAADCAAIQMLMRKAGVTSNDVVILENELRNATPGGARRLPWRARTYDLEGCLPEVAAQRQAAARPTTVSANDCVVHNDAENAILNASRDRLSIEGSYAAANQCDRPVTCTFTIEIGTLPDAEIDVGSWRNFRPQTTITQEYTLPPRPSTSEHRFRGAVGNVPTAQSVDFRIVPACR